MILQKDAEVTWVENRRRRRNDRKTKFIQIYKGRCGESL